MVLTLESVVEILKCENLNESYQAVLFDQGVWFKMFHKIRAKRTIFPKLTLKVPGNCTS